MPLLQTRYFGELPYNPDAVLHFPDGLPGFERAKDFVAVEQPQSNPVVFLQSLVESQLCFIALPARIIDPDYELALNADDRASLRMSEAEPVQISSDLLCLCLVSVTEGGTAANLLAPVVINTRTRRAVQSIQADSGYSHMLTLGGSAAC